MILESIVTTIDRSGRVNLAPMGPIVLPADPTSGWPRFLLRPWEGSQTCANLLANGTAVVHVSDDAALIARAAVGKVSTEGLLCPVSSSRDAQSGDAPDEHLPSVSHHRLIDCHRWFAVVVDDYGGGGSRHELTAHCIAEGVVRPFFGFNRGKHAVIEAAILATRLDHLPLADVQAEMDRLAIPVEKTGGVAERDAFASLQDYIAQQTRRRPATSPSKVPSKVPSEVVVTTGARLHFGLLDVRSPFGGCGVMVEDPATVVRVRPASDFQCDDRYRPRIEAIADRLARHLGRSGRPPVAIEVERASPSHSGLGSGTQISLAVAEALLHACQQNTNGWSLEPSESLVWALADRGHRSAVGSHGFFHGGMIVEGTRLAATGRERKLRGGQGGAAIAPRGQTPPDRLNPLEQRVLMPPDWRVAIFLPRASGATEALLPLSVSGQAEQNRFDRLADVAPQTRGELVSLLLNELVPAVETGDFAGFGDALTRYNRRSGELFAAAQGGPYHGEATTALIERLIRRGARGVGQSSWGPAVFAWFESQSAAESFCEDFAATAEERAVSIRITPVQHRPRQLRCAHRRP